MAEPINHSENLPKQFTDMFEWIEYFLSRNYNDQKPIEPPTDKS